MERRKHPRDIIDNTSHIVFKEQSIPCIISNISEGGALLLISSSNSELIKHDDIGKDIIVQYSDDLELKYSKNGKIIRYTHLGNQIGLAVYLLK